MNGIVMLQNTNKKRTPPVFSGLFYDYVAV